MPLNKSDSGASTCNMISDIDSALAVKLCWHFGCYTRVHHLLYASNGAAMKQSLAIAANDSQRVAHVLRWAFTCIVSNAGRARESAFTEAIGRRGARKISALALQQRAMHVDGMIDHFETC